MAARCNETLYDESRLASLERAEVGKLGGTDGKTKCAHCEALLFDDEAVDSKWLRGRKRGRYCCSDGSVVLPPVQVAPIVRECSSCRDGRKVCVFVINVCLVSEPMSPITLGGRVDFHSIPCWWFRKSAHARMANQQTPNPPMGAQRSSKHRTCVQMLRLSK
tara:strand:- start:3072 stop:3557 length:486 start_codon:yes stop_codon:yes gene_type:complete